MRRQPNQEQHAERYCEKVGDCPPLMRIRRQVASSACAFNLNGIKYRKKIMQFYLITYDFIFKTLIPHILEKERRKKVSISKTLVWLLNECFRCSLSSKYFHLHPNSNLVSEVCLVWRFHQKIFVQSCFQVVVLPLTKFAFAFSQESEKNKRSDGQR